MGTLLNVIGILAGGMAGLLFGRFLLPRYQETLMMATGTAVLFVGIGGAIRHMLVYSNGAFTLQGTVMMIVSLALGAVLGEWWNLAARLERFGEWLKKKTGNGSDRQFVHAFVTSSMTVCIGAMAVVGAIEDGIHGDPSILAAKAALDFLLILVMSVSLGGLVSGEHHGAGAGVETASDGEGGHQSFSGRLGFDFLRRGESCLSKAHPRGESLAGSFGGDCMGVSAFLAKRIIIVSAA